MPDTPTAGRITSPGTGPGATLSSLANATPGPAAAPAGVRQAVAAVATRPAATTLVLRDGAQGVEVLMVRRSLQASFMPGAYVFPGGAVDPADSSAEMARHADETPERLARRLGEVLHIGHAALGFAVGGLRECFEECGLWLGAGAVQADWPSLRAQLHAGTSLATLAQAHGLKLATSALQPWSHWVTPVGIPKRFDTVFFVCRAPDGQVPEVDAGETTTLCWVHPPQALQAHSQGEFPMEFATVSTVRSLSPLATGTVQALLDHAAALQQLPPLHPRLKLDGEGRIRGVLLPGEPGYDQALGDG